LEIKQNIAQLEGASKGFLSSEKNGIVAEKSGYAVFCLQASQLHQSRYRRFEFYVACDHFLHIFTMIRSTVH